MSGETRIPVTVTSVSNSSKRYYIYDIKHMEEGGSGVRSQNEWDND